MRTRKVGGNLSVTSHDHLPASLRLRQNLGRSRGSLDFGGVILALFPQGLNLLRNGPVPLTFPHLRVESLAEHDSESGVGIVEHLTERKLRCEIVAGPRSQHDGIVER